MLERAIDLEKALNLDFRLHYPCDFVLVFFKLLEVSVSPSSLKQAQ